MLSYEKSNEIAQRYGITRDVNNFEQIGSIYCSLGEYDKAKLYLYKALQLAEDSKLKSSIGRVYIKLSNYYLQTNDNRKALDYVKRSIQIAREIGAPILQMEGYDVLTNIYVEKKDYKNAYTANVAHTQIKDSLYNENNLQKLALIESEYTFSKEREQMLQKKAEIRQHVEYQHRLIWALVLIFILIFILVLILFRWGQLKREMLGMELDCKNKELESNRKDIAVAKFKLVQNSERNVHAIKVLEGIANTAQGVDKRSLKNLIGDYKLDGAYTNWEEFEALFNQVNTSFGQNLNRLYPDLTPNERRLCVFLKLNMSNKDISQITFQTEDALKKSRMRLRRKLGIERSVNLASFIQGI
ncbi:MAG: transcriptional regulator [Tannerellaceae bacterium]